MKLRWTVPAINDLTELHGYIAERNPRAALKVAQHIRAHAEGLVVHPEKGRVGRVDGTRELVLPGLPFIVAYRLTEQTVDILAIRHGARAWNLFLPDE